VIHVNGRRFEGGLDAEALAAMIEDELERASALLRAGADRERIYAEIIRQDAARRRASSL
jgi:hypothetical protein